MTTAIHIKTDGTTTVVDLPEESYPVITEMVGGLIDVVRVDDFVVYVHDEGLLIEDFQPNVYASYITQRVIFGDVVIVGCLNDAGYYDGENHDVPLYLQTHSIDLAPVMNADEVLRGRVSDGRDEIMGDPVQIYSQDANGEWVRV